MAPRFGPLLRLCRLKTARLRSLLDKTWGQRHYQTISAAGAEMAARLTVLSGAMSTDKHEIRVAILRRGSGDLSDASIVGHRQLSHQLDDRFQAPIVGRPFASKRFTEI